MTGEMWYKHHLTSVGENRLDFLFIWVRLMFPMQVHLHTSSFSPLYRRSSSTLHHCYHFKNVFLIFNQRIKTWPHRQFICLGLDCIARNSYVLLEGLAWLFLERVKWGLFSCLSIYYLFWKVCYDLWEVFLYMMRQG